MAKFYGDDVRKKAEELIWTNEVVRAILETKNHKFIEDEIIVRYFGSGLNRTKINFIIYTLENEMEFRNRVLSDEFRSEMDEENGAW